MTAITNIRFKIFLDAVLGPKNPKNYQGVENQVFKQFSVKRDFETQDFVYLWCRETINRLSTVRLPWVQSGRRELGLIRTIGKMLGFQTEERTKYVGATAFTYLRTRQEVTSIKLNAWFLRQYLHFNACIRALYGGD